VIIYRPLGSPMRKSTRLSSSQRTLLCRPCPESHGKTETTLLRSPKKSQMIFYGAGNRRTRQERTSSNSLLAISLQNTPSRKARSCLLSLDRASHTKGWRERNIFSRGTSRFSERGKQQTVQSGFWTGLLSSNTGKIRERYCV